MNPSSELNAFTDTTCPPRFLKPSHKATLQVTITIILIAGITLSILSATGHLPQIACYTCSPVSLLALVSLILISYVGTAALPKKQKQSAKTLDLSTKEESEIVEAFPVVSEQIKEGFFVDVLNEGGYLINEKKVSLPPAGTPIKFSRSPDKSFEEELKALRIRYGIQDQKEIAIQFKDETTEQAIHHSKNAVIALNFANEHHAGGGPGFHLDPESKRFVYDAPSAKAQEESMCQRSTLMASLTQLPHTLKPDSLLSNFIRSYYDDEFDSRKMAYASSNHLFGVQKNQNFYETSYLEHPKAVIFITSAGTYYGDKAGIDCSRNSAAYNDASERVRTHLLTAAISAANFKKDHPNETVELILGAFGCGVFAPKGNPNEYRQMIADIYTQLIPHFKGFFDCIIFAVPSFGKTDTSPASENHKIFKKNFDK